MRPILFELNGFALPAWHVFYVLGAIAAFAVMAHLRRTRLAAIPAVEISRLYAVCYVAGYGGARLLSILIEEPQVEGLLATAVAMTRLGAMTFYGGALAAFCCGALYVRAKGLALSDMIDLALPAGMVALALGRIGCFLNGDDYGKAVPLALGEEPPFWAVRFPNLNDEIARYPVQLAEAAAALILAALAIALWQRLRTSFRPGAVGFFTIVAYANWRFLLEFWRDDFRGFVFGSWLSTSQFISALILAVAAASLPVWIARTQKT